MATKTDPITAAHAYREALGKIMQAKALQTALKIAEQALTITYPPPEDGHVSISNGFGQNTQRPFVAFSMTNPAMQMSTKHARELAHKILDAANEAESDGFVMTWLGGTVTRLDERQSGILLYEFRRYRENLRELGS